MTIGDHLVGWATTGSPASEKSKQRQKRDKDKDLCPHWKLFFSSTKSFMGEGEVENLESFRSV